MQVNLVNNLGSTSFGKKENKCKKDCPGCNPNTNNSMVHIPTWFYRGLLATALAGPMVGTMTSCSPMNPPTDPTETIYNPKNTATNPNTYIGGTDTTVVTTPSVSKGITDMVDYLGLKVKTASTIGASEVIKNGDVIEFSYHDDYLNTDDKLKINQELSKKDTMVYDGTSVDNDTGALSYIRHTFTQVNQGTVVKKEITKRGKPPYENSGWSTVGTYKYVPAPDGIKEYKLASDGSEMYQGKFVPKNETSVSRVLPNGETQEHTNVSVTKLQNTDTGLHDVHM